MYTHHIGSQYINDLRSKAWWTPLPEWTALPSNRPTSAVLFHSLCPLIMTLCCCVLVPTPGGGHTLPISEGVS